MNTEMTCYESFAEVTEDFYCSAVDVLKIRSREISACLVLQTRSQLKAIYKDNADTIVGNMDSQIFLGGSEPTTLKDLAEALGKETIDSYNNSDTRGNSPSYGTNYQKLGHDVP